jgi:glycogen(starch) synthase
MLFILGVRSMPVTPRHLWVMTAEYPPHIIGGLGVTATHLTRELASLGLRITVITTTPRRQASINERGCLTVARFPSHYSPREIVRALVARGVSAPDVVHVHSLEYLKLLLYCKRVVMMPSIYTCHSVVRKKRKNPAFSPSRQALMLRSVDHMVVPSAPARIILIRRYPLCATKTTVISHGVHSSDNWAGKVSKYRLLYAGRVVPNKGLEQLIDAIALLRVKHRRVRLYIIGAGSRGYVNQLKQRAISRRVNDLVHWLGRYEHRRLLRAYRRFGAVVMPSRRESFGLVALEALASGVPLVASRTGGLRQFVDNDVAWVIERVDGRAIAQAIAAMWQYPDLTRERVEAGRALARNYGWSQAAKMYLQILDSLNSPKQTVGT